jgi:hypothetical protein
MNCWNRCERNCRPPNERIQLPFVAVLRLPAPPALSAGWAAGTTARLFPLGHRPQGYQVPVPASSSSVNVRLGPTTASRDTFYLEPRPASHVERDTPLRGTRSALSPPELSTMDNRRSAYDGRVPTL